jgi:L-threonylcarbamoyladenylate synthase
VAGHHLLTVEEAAPCLRAGEVIAYPTEAVYGLGCDPLNECAVRKILTLKARPASAGLILLADRFECFEPFICEIPDDKLDTAMDSWPGPITWLFPRAPAVPDWLAGDHPTVALRVTAHPLCRELCAAFGGAIVSTSANPASAPPARSAAQVEEYFGSAIAGIVRGALGDEDRPSEIRDLASGRVLRKG